MSSSLAQTTVVRSYCFHDIADFWSGTAGRRQAVDVKILRVCCLLL